MRKTRKSKAAHRPDWDDDNPEWTEEDFRNARPLREVFPDLAEWSRKRKRAKKGEAHKQAVSIRLSPEVIAFFKSKGAGWQTRVDRALLAFVEAAR